MHSLPAKAESSFPSHTERPRRKGGPRTSAEAEAEADAETEAKAKADAETEAKAKADAKSRASSEQVTKAVTARGIHLFPFRTEKLNPATPMVLRKWESR